MSETKTFISEAVASHYHYLSYIDRLWRDVISKWGFAVPMPKTSHFKTRRRAYLLCKRRKKITLHSNNFTFYIKVKELPTAYYDSVHNEMNRIWICIAPYDNPNTKQCHIWIQRNVHRLYREIAIREPKNIILVFITPNGIASVYTSDGKKLKNLKKY